MLNANALRASMVENNCSVRELAEICGRLHLSVEKRNQIFLRRKFPKGNKCPPRQL